MLNRILPLVVAFSSSSLLAEENKLIEEVYVTGGAQAIKSLAGSASLVDAQAIEEFDVTDLTGLLSQVPGVYIRFEDGYGLRPNIGIRGATSDRSQKVTLMEDGILIAPSPYAAPAAYYIPNVNRMDAVEVFKGPASIHYGPHTVGGALNMVTRAIPASSTKEISLTAGSNNYYKTRFFWGENFSQTGFWVDAFAYGADGFKELEGQDTGFERSDINAKWQWRSSESTNIQQVLDIKVGYADETSDETYLGLSDDDFAANSLQRYAASALDQFTSEHTQVHVLHQAKFSPAFKLNTKAYYNRFDRSWDKFDGFFIGVNSGEFFVQDILARPDDYFVEMQLLRGERDSNGSPEQTIKLTNNAREYGSQGLEVGAEYGFESGEVSHLLEFGLRYHNDYVDRDHTSAGYLMQSGQLVFDGITGREKVDWNRAEVNALAFFISDEIQWNNLKINIGLRAENIDGEFSDYKDDSFSEKSDSVIIPGVGAFYQFNERVGLLVGVNKGFSPSGPSAKSTDGSEVEPEESVNLEYGLRYSSGEFSFDAIGFFSDYSNLLGRCRASDSACVVGQEFNGGEVQISGLELVGAYYIGLENGWSIPLNLTYTFTEAYFQSNFTSGFSQWGDVIDGDEVPYTPEHQARFQFGVQAVDWSLIAALKYYGEMREVPGQGSVNESELIQSYFLIDLAAQYDFNDNLSFRLVAENLGDKQTTVARRPFGARPNHPRAFKLGVDYKF